MSTSLTATAGAAKEGGTGEPLRIAILANGLRIGGGLSVGLNMIPSLGRVAPQHHYFCVVPANLGYEPICEALPHGEYTTHEHRGYVGRWRFDNIELPRLVRGFAPDVIFGLNGRGLAAPGCPQAAFPQDPHFFYPRKHFGRYPLIEHVKGWYHKCNFQRQLPKMQMLFVQTRTVERRLRELFAYRGQIRVIGSSISPFMRETATGHAAPAPLRALEGKYKLLYLTRYYTHKNLEALVPLFREHGDALRDVVAIITISPDRHANASSLLRDIERCGLADKIINVGPVPHDEVGGYYEHCDALLMPTLLETFGLPYLEAMNFRLPILTSDLDFARDVCGEAALFFNPWDSTSIRDAILRLRADRVLRERMIAAGVERVSQDYPTWDEIAQRVVNGLAEIAHARSA